jgi:sugar phosphate isomerase/epimerase
MLCIETLDYPYELIEPVVNKHGMSICLDVGHLVFFGYPLSGYFDRYLSQTRVIHLHGHCDGMDHRDIGTLEPEALETLTGHADFGDGRERVLTLEIFGLPDFEQSMEVMGRLHCRKHSVNSRAT